VANSNSEKRISLEAFSKVVEGVYDCALDPNRWHDTIRMIADQCGSQVSIFAVHDFARNRSELTFGIGYSEKFVRLHEEKYASMNPFLSAIQMLPLGVVTTQAMLIHDSEHYESRFYQEWCKPQSFHDSIQFNVLRTKERLAWWAAHRLESYPRYGDTDVRLLTLLAPHVCRAEVRLTTAVAVDVPLQVGGEIGE
jgi:hypothetical protein